MLILLSLPPFFSFSLFHFFFHFFSFFPPFPFPFFTKKFSTETVNMKKLPAAATFLCCLPNPRAQSRIFLGLGNA